MERIADITESKDHQVEWLKENEQLIEKLELAFKAVPDNKITGNVSRFYGLQLDSLHLLIDNNASSELLENNTIFPIPLSADWIIGVVNVRGDVVPVINIEQMITGNTKAYDINNCNIMMVGKGDNAIAMVLDKLPTPISFSNSDKLGGFSKLPASIREHTEYAYMRDDIIWSCINFSSFIKSLNR